MTIGLIILGVAAVLIFFGAAERYFEMLGITSWLAFLIILTFVLGAVVPAIEVGAAEIGIGGFVIPIIVTVIIVALSRRSGNMWRSVPSLLLCAVITAGLRVLLRPTANDALVCSLLTGFLAGAIAFVVSHGRINIIISAVGGIVVGDIIGSSVLFAVTEQKTLTIGAHGMFDAIIIAAAFGLILFEVISALKNVRVSAAAKANLNTEAAEDVAIEPEIETHESAPRKNILDYLDD